jgi:hypothetical protein
LKDIPKDAILIFNGCVWSDADSLISASLYPEVLALDTTQNTNLKNYPFTFCVGVNGENKSENWLTGLLPNERRLTFIWLLREMLPLFLGKALEGLQTVLSDGNNELIDAINYTIESSVFPRGTVRLLCYWHTISLFLMNSLPWIPNEISKCLKDSLYEIATDCDTLKDAEEYWEAIIEYVTRKFKSEGTQLSVLDVLNTIRSKQAQWCRAWFPNARNFGEITSGRVETENLQHKKDDQVHSRTSMKQTVEADFLRMGRRKVVNQTTIRASLWFPILETTKDQTLPPWVREKLTIYGADLFREQWSLSHNYTVSQLGPSVLSVTYNTHEKADVADVEATTKCHTISIVNQFMHCHCIFVISHTMICRHLLAAMHHLQIKVQASHIHLRWHKSWKNGMFLSEYHRTFNDGINSIGLPFPLSNLSSYFSQDNYDSSFPSPPSPPSPSSPSSPSSVLLPSSPSLSAIEPPFKPYVSLRRRLDSFTSEILQMCSHSKDASKWAMEELDNMQESFHFKYTQELLDNTSLPDGRVTSDLPLTRKRALFRFERVRKRSARHLEFFDTYHQPSSSSQNSPPRTRSQSEASRSTPPLFES